MSTVTNDKKKENFYSRSDELVLKEHGYILNGQLGEGSYSRVYKASQSKRGVRDDVVACKVVNTKIAPKEIATKFLPREIDILSKIVHPHIIHVLAIYQKLFNYFIFMRYAEQGDLLDYIIGNNALPEIVARVWFHQLSSAVFYLHQLNIAHRDIKCENVLISKNLNIKLTDFGFARTVIDNNGNKLLSETHCGSLAYASPETLLGRAYYPKTSDIWSLGVVLFIMLNKCMPFQESNVRDLYKQQVEKKWKFRARLIPLLTVNSVNLVKKLLEPNFRKRMTVNELMKDEWFVKGQLKITEDCKIALLTTTKFLETVYSKKIVRHTETEKDFKVIFRGRDARDSVSGLLDLPPMELDAYPVIHPPEDEPPGETSKPAS